MWLARGGRRRARSAARVGGGGEAKTSIVFWGAGDGSAGWLVSCLAELSERDISLTRIESRPRRIGLGHYMFFADFEGARRGPAVAAAVEGLRARCQEVRVLGSYRARLAAPGRGSRSAVARLAPARWPRHRPTTSGVRVARRAPATRA